MRDTPSIMSAELIDLHYFETDDFYPSKQLMGALNAMFTHPLTVVSAPFGYGQALAVRCFLERTHAQVFWHRVVKQAPDVIWENICNSLHRVDPVLSDALEHIDLRDDRGWIEAVAAIDIQVYPSSPSVLVLEDFQHVPGEVIKFLTLIVKRSIRNLHIVLITTCNFPVDDELLLGGRVNRITMETLALNRQEVIRAFDIGQTELSEEEVDFVCAYSEGWLAAVQFLLMCRRSNPSLSLVRPDDYDERFLLAFEQTTVKRIPRPFMTLLCYLTDRVDFTLEEADFFLAFDAEADENAFGILQYMIDHLMFVTYSPTEKLYHLHPVLRRMVQRFILPSMPSGRLAEINKRKALWCEQNAQFDQALHYYDLANDEISCLRVVRCLARFQDLSVTVSLVRRLFESYCRVLQEHSAGTCLESPSPEVLTALARYAALLGDSGLYEEILIQIDHAQSILIPKELSNLYRDVRRLKPSGLHAWMLALDDKQSLAALSDCFDISYGGTSLLFALPLPYSELNRRCELWKDFAGEDTRRGNLFAGASSLLFAEMQFLSGKFVEAEIYLHAATRNAREAGNPGVWITSCCTLARLLGVQGNTEGARQLLSDVRRELEREGPSRLDATLDLCAYSISLLEGHPERVAPWLFDEAEAARRLYTPALQELKCLRQLKLLFEGRYAEYISYCMEEEGGLEFKSPLQRMVCKIGLAYARGRAGLTDSAMEALYEALAIAEPGGFYAPFMLLRRWMRALPGVKDEPRLSEALRKVEALCAGNRFRRPVSEILETDQIKSQSLTRREAEAAKCLREGISNREIASQLCISENTVKSILKKLYAKLEIHSRHDFTRDTGADRL